jgi:ParB-like nuclease domain
MPRENLRVERWPIDRLLPYAANARTHGPDQVAQIAASIAEFGFNVPCLIDERGVLIAGHGRLLAAKYLGLLDVPVIQLGHLTDARPFFDSIDPTSTGLKRLAPLSVLCSRMGSSPKTMTPEKIL